MPADALKRRLIALAFAAFLLLTTLACGAGTQTAAIQTSITAAPVTQTAAATQSVASAEATPSVAAAIPTVVPQVTTDRAINLRSGPGTDYPIVKKLPASTSVVLLAFQGTGKDRWYRVRVGDIDGWLSSTVVNVEPSVAQALPTNQETIAPPVVAKPAVVAKPPAKPAVPISGNSGSDAPAAAPSGGRTGATCRDGSHSNATGRGACSHHGGVAQWLYGP